MSMCQEDGWRSTGGRGGGDKFPAVKGPSCVGSLCFMLRHVFLLARADLVRSTCRQKVNGYEYKYDMCVVVLQWTHTPVIRSIYVVLMDSPQRCRSRSASSAGTPGVRKKAG